MVFPTCPAKTTYIHDLPSEPNQTSQELRDLFDQCGEEIVEYLNNSFKSYIEGIATQVDINKTKIAGAEAEEIEKLSGVTDPIQTQLNGKQKAITSGTDAKVNADGVNGDIYLRYSNV